jgi:hypothetical protein
MFFAHEEILFPPELAEALRAATGGNHGPALARLWEKLAKGRGQVGEGEKHYSFSRTEAEAYAAYYLPANALKTALVLEEAFLLGRDLLGADTHWLDLGTGPGTAYWGLAWWAAARDRPLRFTGWDQSPIFAEIASRLASSSTFPALADFQAKREDPVALVRRLAPTHVSFVNSLAEIYPDPALRLAACGKILTALKDSTRKDGRARYLLVIEPGSRESSRELATLKDTLTEKSVLLPCLDSRPCGALANPKDWCHEEVACRFPDWLNEIGEAVGMRKESLLFSYALWGSAEGDSAFAGSSRVVSQRLERKGQVECWVCTREGKKFARVQRSKARDGNELLLGAGRGDLWRDLRVGEKGDFDSASPLNASGSSIFRPA